MHPLTNPAPGPHQGQPILTAGAALEQARAALILIHGRGASAADILGLADHIGAAGLAYLAPQAAQHTWYPHSFLSPLEQNEPHLASALATLAALLDRVGAAGIPPEKVVICGFSQGACLSSEFVARQARRYGGLIAFSGGLIGPPGTPRDYSGALEATPVFIGCSDIDFHIPLERVHETSTTLRQLGASVTEKIYPGLGHTIIQDELDQARQIVAELV
jgi:predicted esterase